MKFPRFQSVRRIAANATIYMSQEKRTKMVYLILSTAKLAKKIDLCNRTAPKYAIQHKLGQKKLSTKVERKHFGGGVLYNEKSAN